MGIIRQKTEAKRLEVERTRTKIAILRSIKWHGRATRWHDRATPHHGPRCSARADRGGHCPTRSIACRTARFALPLDLGLGLVSCLY